LYHQSTDITYILFKEGPRYEAVEAGSGIVLELDVKGEIMGLEIWNAKKNAFIDLACLLNAREIWNREFPRFPAYTASSLAVLLQSATPHW